MFTFLTPLNLIIFIHLDNKTKAQNRFFVCYCFFWFNSSLVSLFLFVDVVRSLLSEIFFSNVLFIIFCFSLFISSFSLLSKECITDERYWKQKQKATTNKKQRRIKREWKWQLQWREISNTYKRDNEKESNRTEWMCQLVSNSIVVRIVFVSNKCVCLFVFVIHQASKLSPAFLAF